MARSNFKDVDSYIATFPSKTRIKLQEIRSIFKQTIPEAEESISYQIPVYKLNGKFVGYFAAFKNHISFYPIPNVADKLKKQMEPYLRGKSTLRFSLNKPIPKDLVTSLMNRWVEIRLGDPPNSTPRTTSGKQL